MASGKKFQIRLFLSVFFLTSTISWGFCDSSVSKDLSLISLYRTSTAPNTRSEGRFKRRPLTAAKLAEMDEALDRLVVALQTHRNRILEENPGPSIGGPRVITFDSWGNAIGNELQIAFRMAMERSFSKMGISGGDQALSAEAHSLAESAENSLLFRRADLKPRLMYLLRRIHFWVR
jgi:hypothetical protein